MVECVKIVILIWHSLREVSAIGKSDPEKSPILSAKIEADGNKSMHGGVEALPRSRHHQQQILSAAADLGRFAEQFASVPFLIETISFVFPPT